MKRRAWTGRGPSCYFSMGVFLVEAGFLLRNFFTAKIAGKMAKRMMGYQRLIMNVHQFLSLSMEWDKSKNKIP
jgi:hypothetical protein